MLGTVPNDEVLAADFLCAESLPRAPLATLLDGMLSGGPAMRVDIQTDAFESAAEELRKTHAAAQVRF